MTEEQIKEWLLPVQDLELNLSLVELGLIYEAKLEGDKAFVKMSLTSPGCPVAGEMVALVKDRLLVHPEIKDADVQVVFEPKWDPAVMASDAVKDRLGIW